MSSPIFFFIGSSLWNIILTRTPRTLMPLTSLKSSTMLMRCCLTSLRGTFMTSTAPWVCMCRSSLGRRMWTHTLCSPAGGQRWGITLYLFIFFTLKMSNLRNNFCLTWPLKSPPIGVIYTLNNMNYIIY